MFGPRSVIVSVGMLFLAFSCVEAQGAAAAHITRATLDAGGGGTAGPGPVRLRSASLGSGVQTGLLAGRLRLTSGFVQRGAVNRVPIPADFNGDGRVDFDDFFLFAAAFGSRDAKFDLSRDGRVDFDDFFLFAAQFGKRR